VQVTEPHFVALMNYKAQDEEVSFRNQILITVALLSPEARFQVQKYALFIFLARVFCQTCVALSSWLFQISLNETHPLEGTPSVRAVPAVPAVHTDNLVGFDVKVSTTLKRRLFHHPRHDKNKQFSPTTTSNKDSDASADENSPSTKADYNIVPGALTERDVQRLAWAVQRVRSIVRDMRLQDLSALTEVSPGTQVGLRLSSTNGFGRGSSNSSDSGVGSEEEEENDKELAEWVIFLSF